MAAIIEASNIQRITISKISKLNQICTPEVFIYGIPWHVKVFKEKSTLNFYLKCNNSDNSANWSIPGVVSCKLLSFNGDTVALERYAPPYIFNSNRRTGFTTELIAWDELFKQDKGYAKHDEIKLEIKIEVENPKRRKKCEVRILRDCKFIGEYRLILKNVSHLMAVKAHPIKLYGLSWYISVGKDNQSNGLFATLDFDKSRERDSSDVTWSIKLLCMKVGMRSIERTKTALLLSSEYLAMENIAQWDEIINPKNGFIINDSITLELELKMKAENPRGTVWQNTGPIAKRIRSNPRTISSPSRASASSE